MITGFDSVFIADGSISEKIQQFLNEWLLRWPKLRVSLDNESVDVFAEWSSSNFSISEGSARILVARDISMEASWDERGYVLDSQEEGPFCIAYEPFRRNELRATALDDPYMRSGFRYDPYEITIVGSQLYLVTVVTPCLESNFSRTVLSGVIRSLGHASG